MATFSSFIFSQLRSSSRIRSHSEASHGWSASDPDAHEGLMNPADASVAVIVSQCARCSGLVGAVSTVASPAMFHRFR